MLSYVILKLVNIAFMHSYSLVVALVCQVFLFSINNELSFLIYAVISVR